MDSKAIRILLVEDDVMLQRSLLKYLSGEAGLEIVGTATNGFHALEILERCSVDVVVSDLRMPGMDGVELFQRLKDKQDGPRFIAITAHDRDEAMLELLRNGANGYIVKGDSIKEISRSIYAAMHGETVVSSSAMTRLLTRVENATERPTSPDTSGLAPTAARILNLVCLGRSNQKISEEIGMNIASVKKQVSGLLKYFEVSSRSELIVSMHRQGYMAK